MAEEVPIGGIVVAVDVNQAAPEWGDGDSAPGLSPVRLLLTQRVSRDLSDITMLISRRQDLRSTLHSLNGPIG